uniref:cAMP responsive element binding protein 3 n=1 Tax=Naja naja TaxID=35670 RepID=A0A8C6XK07_NAJNA
FLLFQLDFPPLVLTDEEQQLLEKEGISIPSHLPLTKAEERVLKRVRRKIRNKQSAQDSRRRKKVYMDNLESRWGSPGSRGAGGGEHPLLLRQSLLEQLKKLQALIQHSSTKTAAASTCVLVSFCASSPLAVLSRKLREFPSGASRTLAGAPQPAEVTMPPSRTGSPRLLSSEEAVSPKAFGAAESLNASLEGPPNALETGGGPSASNGSSSLDSPSPALEGLLLTPKNPPGKERALPPASVDQQPGWAGGASSVILQPHRSDEM